MELFKKDNYSISFNSYGNQKNQIIVLLPPGVGNSNHFQKLGKLLSKSFFVIVIDLPGTNKSSCSSCNMDQISKRIIDFIETKKIKNFILIGESYGANLAINISNSLDVKKIVLVGGGNFFNIFSKLFLTVIFLPPKFSKIIRKSYATLLTKLNIFDFSDYSDCQLNCIQKRWNEIIWYENPKFENKTNTLIINSKNDYIVNKRSISRIRANYKNHKFVLLNCSHFKYVDYLSTDYNNVLLDFINS